MTKADALRQHLQNGLLTSSMLGIGCGMVIGLLANGNGFGAFVLAVVVYFARQFMWALYRTMDKRWEQRQRDLNKQQEKETVTGDDGNDDEEQPPSN